ncbi:hypothetical protein Rsub_12962 [Raphidocelis subcapitata]|uniref:Uncharacterized protein n=1 Tax=Raphidocelis subcapitata TaxID=307507 RepID=A0A2V0PMH0_9CHLO|nr:hypothetical protein Rsub_12962 [Raphidocelis subcapitata]|eukprot:GBG00283.1 hypothetical protein Rsub_12962 [Raphidocelis subcapitata]
MGWISNLVGQIAITSVVLGGLKRHGVISMQPQNVKNDTLRLVFTQAVSLGEEVNIMAEKLIASVQEEMNNPRKR